MWAHRPQTKGRASRGLSLRDSKPEYRISQEKTPCRLRGDYVPLSGPKSGTLNSSLVRVRVVYLVSNKDTVHWTDFKTNYLR